MTAVFASAGQIAADLRAGAYTSRALVEAYIARIEAWAQTINAVVVERFAAARAEADAADAALRAGAATGSLHGVPITIKESFDFAGLPSTFGHPERAGHRAGAHALVVSRLLAAGAIVLGKTNVPKDLADWQSFNAIYGETKNPWDLERSPGGSSGGSAAALASGLSALELGSDIAGSIRVPAAYCGVWGHKPTFGVVPMRGHGLAERSAPADILVAGPLARSAYDLELALSIVAGADVCETDYWRLALPSEPRQALSQFRIAVVGTDPHFPVDASIQTALAQLSEALADAGGQVVIAPKLPLPSQQTYSLFITLLRGATSARLNAAQLAEVRQRAAQFAPDDVGYDALMHRGLSISHWDWLAAHDRRRVLRDAWRAFFQTYDALICPITTTPAFPHMFGVPKIEQMLVVDGSQRPASDTYYWIGLPSVAYLPATAIPIGQTADGLPVGAQIIGPEGADQRCLRLAQLIETAYRSFVPPAGYRVSSHRPILEQPAFDRNRNDPD